MSHIAHRRVLLGIIVFCSTIAGIGYTYAVQAKPQPYKIAMKNMPGMAGMEGEFGNLKPPVDAGPNEIEAQKLLLPEQEPATSDAHIKGKWSRVGRWPIVPIHSVLLPNGKVLTYGTNPAADNGTGFFYDVWDPTKGLRQSSHTTLPVMTDTNIFCSGQIIVPGTGEVLILGGSIAKNGVRNFGINAAQFFNSRTNTLRQGTRSMDFARWYPAATALGNGNILVQGGRDDNKKPVLTPEIYNAKTGTWKLLTGATSSEVYNNGWWYTKSYLAAGGKVVVFPRGSNKIWNLDPRGNGSLTQVGTVPGPNFSGAAPAVMYDAHKVLLVQGVQRASIVNIRKPDQPEVTETGALSKPRHWANAVALPNGEVLAVGGASVNQKEENAVKYAEIWNPSTGQWRAGASGAKSRLYHSTALLLPDGRVLVGGGGPPGPVVNQNAEIFSPPYLFKPDGSGKRAPRPIIRSAPGRVRYGQNIEVNFTNAQKISRISLVRLGSVTHSFNMDERMRRLGFKQNGKQVNIQFPRGRNVTPPGYYMLFLVNDKGVPSKARIIKLQ